MVDEYVTILAEAGKEEVREIKKQNKTMEKRTAKTGHNHDENEDEDNIHGDDDDTQDNNLYIF